MLSTSPRVWIGFVLAAGCQAPAVSHAPPTPPAVVIASTPPRASAALDPLAEIRARGSFHAEPIHIPADGDLPEQWIVFLGSPTVARAVWRVRRDASPTPLRGWPDGVRVVAHRLAGDGVHVIVETLAVLAQPARLRAAIPIPFERPPRPQIGWSESVFGPRPAARPSLDLAGVRDLADLDARLTAPAPAPLPEGAPSARLAAATSLRHLQATIASRGLDYGHLWQRTFIEPRARYEAAAFSARPEARRVLASLAEPGPEATFFGSAPEPEVHTTVEAGREVIDAVLDVADGAPPSEAARRVVPGHAVTPESAALLREQVPGEPTLLAEAAWGERGSVTVAADAEGKAIAMFHEGDYVHVSSLLAGAREDARPVTAPRFTAAFADIDGDGRTDVVLRAESADGSSSWAFVTPPVLPPPDTDLLADDASAPYALAAKTAGEAAAELVHMPTRAATPAEVRRLLAPAPMAARIFYYREADGTRGLLEAAPADRRGWWQTRARCNEAGGCVLRCEARRPVCRSMLLSGSTALPYREAYYWPAWKDGRMQLFAAAFASDGTSTAF